MFKTEALFDLPFHRVCDRCNLHDSGDRSRHDGLAIVEQELGGQPTV